MQKIIEYYDFETFVKEMNEQYAQKKTIIENAVSEIKKKYGETAKEFIATVKEKGVDDLKDFVVKTVSPIEHPETRILNADYNSILSGLVSWVMLSLQIDKDK